MRPLDRARHIARTFGIRSAATFLRRRGYSIRIALWLLVGREERV